MEVYILSSRVHTCAFPTMMEGDSLKLGGKLKLPYFKLYLAHTT